MTIHLMIISMDGNEPTITNEKLLNYLGFNDETKGKQVNGKVQEFVLSITPEIKGTYIKILDENIDCPQLTVVYEKIIENPPDKNSIKDGLDLHEKSLITCLHFLVMSFGIDLTNVLKQEYDEEGNYCIVFPEISKDARDIISSLYRENRVGCITSRTSPLKEFLIQLKSLVEEYGAAIELTNDENISVTIGKEYIKLDTINDTLIEALTRAIPTL